MKKYNVILIYNTSSDKILMCKRAKNPYKGLFNLPGGKIERDEIGKDSAYRELEEETGISKEDVVLHHIMDFTYYLSECELEIYAGKLNKEVRITEEVNKLHWMDLGSNFFDMSLFAGEGNIGHMVEQVKLYSDQILE